MSPIGRREFLSASAIALGGLAPGGAFRAWRSEREDGRHFVERWSWAMGQPVHLRLFTDDEAHGYEAAQAAFAELRRMEAILSRFDPASELNALHAGAGRRAHRASPELLAVLTAAGRARAESGDAFNVAIEPLMRVWGFREPRLAPPGEMELAEARAALRASVVRIDGERVFLPAAHTRLDLGGIGVGAALDRAGMVLRGRGIRRALLDVSGDVLAIGTPPGEPGWPVEIVAPGVPEPGRPPLATATLRDEALATSGQDAQAIQLGTRRVGHIIDPVAGLPVTARRQATVRAPSALTADLGSTALLVSGRPGPAVGASWIV